MAETLETATTTDLALDYDVPIEFELDSDVASDLLPISIHDEFFMDDLDLDASFTTMAFGEEVPDWLDWEEGEVHVITVLYPSPDAETPVVSDPV